LGSEICPAIESIVITAFVILATFADCSGGSGRLSSATFTDIRLLYNAGF
jgi:hypothetical protein